MDVKHAAVQVILGQATLQYTIPSFQRPYSWKRKQWIILWDDLTELLKQPREQPHFLGPIITSSERSTPTGVNKHLVIDGQQRLTTLTLLLAAIRDTTKNVEFSEKVNDLFCINRHESGEDRLKVLTSIRDRVAYSHILNKFGETESTSKVTECYEYFKEKLKKIDDIVIEKIYYIITQKFFVVHIGLTEADNPYMIFESINFKGVRLNQSDLIKNYIFMCIESDKQNEIHEKMWLPIEHSITKAAPKQEDSMTDFFWFFLTMANEVWLKQNEVYVEIKKHVNKKNVFLMLNEFKKYSKYYVNLLDPSTVAEPKVREVLLNLGRIDTMTYAPFVLRLLYVKYEEQKITSETLIEMLRILESFIVRRFACFGSKGLNKEFPSLNKIFKQKFSVDTLRKALDKKSFRFPTDKDVLRAFKENSFYRSRGKNSFLKFILEQIELSYNHKEKIDYNRVEIEHIMPQKLDSKWESVLSITDKSNHSSMVDTIGNLTLSAYNQELSRKLFSEKLKEYTRSNLLLNIHLKEYNEWNTSAIHERSRKLALQFNKIWPYVGYNSTELFDSNTTDPTNRKPREVIIYGQKIVLNKPSWFEATKSVLAQLLELDPDLPKFLMQDFPSHISHAKNDFKESSKPEVLTKYKGEPVYMPSFTSAKMFLKIIENMFERVGIHANDYSIDY